MVDQAFSSRKEATDYAMDHFCEYVCGIKIVEKYVWDDSGQNGRVTDVYDVETKTVKMFFHFQAV